MCKGCYMYVDGFYVDTHCIVFLYCSNFHPRATAVYLFFYWLSDACSDDNIDLKHVYVI